MHTFEVKVADLMLALNAVKHAAPAKDIRYYLNGIRFEVGDVHCTLIATDGHRLATCKLSLAPDTVPVLDGFAFVLETDKVPQLLAWLKGLVYKSSVRTVRVEYEQRAEGQDTHGKPFAKPGELRLQSFDDKAIFTARPHDEIYPDWRRVMLTEAGLKGSLHSAGCFKGEYLADVGKVAKLFNTKYGGMRMYMSDKQALFACSDANGNEFNETLMGMRD